MTGHELPNLREDTVQKMKFSMKGFFITKI